MVISFAGYDVQFNESGTQYTEKIQVDTDKQTESFKVPAHNNVDGSKILHDFKASSQNVLRPCVDIPKENLFLVWLYGHHFVTVVYPANK
ncbi:hypothetical protein pdam_00022695 [Pocillopora damicornis]|uniref:Uncharacterized protein n=1 Tax=Pocillopora damicornis TaxID=46731 RepID=A0A3M6UWX2_POCDA|nr:hypothetical protein pdam_00022695 [Pocillopora damicornis]